MNVQYNYSPILVLILVTLNFVHPTIKLSYRTLKVKEIWEFCNNLFLVVSVNVCVSVCVCVCVWGGGGGGEGWGNLIYFYSLH